MLDQEQRRSSTCRTLVVAFLVVGALFADASPASALDVLIEPSRPTVDQVTPPTKSVLAQKGSSYDSLKSQAESTMTNSVSKDVAPDAKGHESKIEDALKRCLSGALGAAAGAAELGGNVSETFLSSAETCLREQLNGLNPTEEAIKNAADYLQAGVGGAVKGEEPAPPGPASDGSSIPWWGWAIGGVVVLVIGASIRGKASGS
jgi:hypothetical protein